MNKSLLYKSLAWACGFAIVACLATNIFLSLGFIYQKWTGPSMTLGFGSAILAGAFAMGAIYFSICAAMEGVNKARNEEFYC